MQKYENLNCNEIHYTECIVCNHTVLSNLPLAQKKSCLHPGCRGNGSAYFEGETAALKNTTATTKTTATSSKLTQNIYFVALKK